MKIPYSSFISIQFNYIGFIIISIFIFAIKKFLIKKESNQELIQEKLIYNKLDIETEYGVEQGDCFLFVNLFFVAVTDLLEEIIYKFKCSLFNYWMFEMLFFEFFNSKLLKTKIYKHHIFSFIFILSSCSLLKTIIIILFFKNNKSNTKIFENRIWLIPSGIGAYLLSIFFKAYICCNEKYYLEKRIISITNYLLIYGIFGLILSSICAIISSYVPCGDDNIPELSKIICTYQDDNGTYFFDSYSLFFKDLASDYLGLRLILIIIQSILYYASNYYIYVIYKKLSPIYHICMKRLDFVVLDILLFINDLINNNIQDIDITINIFDILILLFYVFGSAVYLEFIELNFCYLNFCTRRNIRERANTDTRISLGEISINSDAEDKDIKE